ncbi:unnamed protein product [Arctia plantaginis]|uniref:Uncharacterized protein n=1 Tax=Arctia plantaginis TaxID=874455 RepID=A0A8S0YTZ2_ARCPL|nr:unnamed protein product [Arctia plantaginis]
MFWCLSMKAPDRYVAISLAPRVRFRSTGFGCVRKRSSALGRCAGCSRAKGVAWKTTRYTRNAGLSQTV